MQTYKYTNPLTNGLLEGIFHSGRTTAARQKDLATFDIAKVHILAVS